MSGDALTAGRYLALSGAIAGLPGLAALLGAPVARVRPFTRPPAGAAVLAWGRKPSAAAAAAYAARHGLPVLHLEDGFARSVTPGRAEPPLSLVLDDRGIYYDAGTPSRLEALIAAPDTPGRLARGRRLLDLWRRERVSKYNQAREWMGALPEGYVLVADQTAGDASIRCGRADAASFARMLTAALDEHPRATVVLKVHPEVASGRKRGHFDLAAAAATGRVRVIGRDVHPAGLLAGAAAVYAVTSQLGFEALLWGRPTRVFGLPFYAGWGLTDDDLPAPDRRGPASLDSLVAAALDEYPRYRDPETGQRCPAERVISWLGLQRRLRERFPATVHGLGFSAWKRPIARTFFQGSRLVCVRRAEAVPAGASLAVWGRRRAGLPGTAGLVRLEDGFLRSVGLGVDLVRPVSLVMDRSGLYYDAGAPSDLERLLAETDFSPALLARARALRERLVARGLTKYNVGRGEWTRPAGVSRVVLVPGQVEADASIAYGAGGQVRTNLELLRAAREAEPDAYLVYKPHPDVVAGICRPGRGEDRVGAWCDAVVVDAPMDVLLSRVDAVHVLTSLAGFEALLREREVFCHGWPFYAGWGLTTDDTPPPRRGRRLELDALVAGTLLLYPTYVHPVTGRFTTAEGVLDVLAAWRAAGRRLPWWRKRLRFFLALLKRAG